MASRSLDFLRRSRRNTVPSLLTPFEETARERLRRRTTMELAIVILLGIVATYAGFAAYEAVAPGRVFPKVKHWRTKGAVFLALSLGLNTLLRSSWASTSGTGHRRLRVRGQLHAGRGRGRDAGSGADREPDCDVLRAVPARE